MSDGTKIEWADATWNPMSGCSPVSAGCANCYAERMARRNLHPANDGRPPFAVRLHPERLGTPYRWREPRRIFVCSTGDLFHEDVSFEFIQRVFIAAQDNPRHTFLFLTKRPERMREFIAKFAPVPAMTGVRWGEDYKPRNVWFGVTAENQEQADARIPVLLSIPAARRFVSIEPMLGPVDIEKHLRRRMEPGLGLCPHGSEACNCGSTEIPGVAWVIVGGETGPGARPMHPDWPRLVRDQCVAAGVPFMFKQWGEFDESGKRVGRKAAGRLLDGRVWNEYPEGQGR
jgi:protein gp37